MSPARLFCCVAQHEVLLQPCGFTDIAVVRVPEKSNARIKSPNETYKRRWLLFVDQRRGLLGRTVLACPTRAEPLPRRRRSYQSYTPSTTAGSIASLRETNAQLQAKPSDLSPTQDARCEEWIATARPRTQGDSPSDHTFEFRQDEDRRTGRRRRSLPLLTERFTGSAGDGTDCRSNLAAEDNHDHVGDGSRDSLPAEGSEPISSVQREDVDSIDGRSVPGALLEETFPRDFTEASSPSTKDEHSKKTRSGSAIYGAPAPTAAAPSVLGVQALSDGMGEEKGEGEGRAVEVLLHGLNGPFLVAAAAGAKSMGVFFVDHAIASKNNGTTKAAAAAAAATTTTTTTTTTTAAAVPSQVRVLDQTNRRESIKRTRVSHSMDRPDPDRTGRLRFLRWGADHPITLVKDLCNPVALCVSSSDSSVFVLEEMSERQQRKDENDRDRGRQQQYPRRSKPRYQVCRLDGARLSAWLTYAATRSPAVGGSEFATRHSKQNGQAGNDITELNAGGERGPTGFSADNTNFLDDESETEWETSSDSDGGDFGERGDECFPGGLSAGAVVKEAGPVLATRSRRQRGVVSFARVLELPSAASSRTNGSEGHPEQPVDMCVLVDGTIVVAFSRSAPLHGGASIAESQGVVRAFPAAGSRARRARPGGVGTALSSTSTADQTLTTTRTSAVEASRVADDFVGNNVDDGWLVAEGLPVVTGLAAGGGDAVYLSLCGARHDGVVTAIGALSAKGVRSRTNGREGRGESTGGRESMLATGIGSTHRSGESFVRIASGFAAALAVDDDMNL